MVGAPVRLRGQCPKQPLDAMRWLADMALRGALRLRATLGGPYADLVVWRAQQLVDEVRFYEKSREARRK